MATVNFTTQEFTSRLDQAFDLADKGEKVIIRRGRRRAYRLIPFTEEPSKMMTYLHLPLTNLFIPSNRSSMATVNLTAQEFTSYSDKAFNMADKGSKVIIGSDRRQPYLLVLFTETLSDITPELQAKIDRAREEYRRGETLHFESKEEMHAWLDAL